MIFGKLRNSSLLEAHNGFEGKKVSPRISEIPNHQEEQLDGSCEDNKQDHADDTLHSDVNELKASDEPTGFVVIFRSIYSRFFVCQKLYALRMELLMRPIVNIYIVLKKIAYGIGSNSFNLLKTVP